MDSSEFFLAINFIYLWIHQFFLAINFIFAKTTEKTFFLELWLCLVILKPKLIVSILCEKILGIQLKVQQNKQKVLLISCPEAYFYDLFCQKIVGTIDLRGKKAISSTFVLDIFWNRSQTILKRPGKFLRKCKYFNNK